MSWFVKGLHGLFVGKFVQKGPTLRIQTCKWEELVLNSGEDYSGAYSSIISSFEGLSEEGRSMNILPCFKAINRVA